MVSFSTSHPGIKPASGKRRFRALENHALIGYEAKDVRPDTDFQLFFAPQKQDVSLDLLTYRDNDDDDGYFLLLASPGAKAKETHLPNDVTFVLDPSGSMADDNK